MEMLDVESICHHNRRSALNDLQEASGHHVAHSELYTSFASFLDPECMAKQLAKHSLFSFASHYF